MSKILPILFNTEMVRAIMDGRKRVTRRAIKFPVNPYTGKVPKSEEVSLTDNCSANQITFKQGSYEFTVQKPYHPGDILYIRETWDEIPVNSEGNLCGGGQYFFRADGDLRPEGWNSKWHPSIHMPKEAARIWLKVTEVRVERLQDITSEQCIAEGVEQEALEIGGEFAHGIFNGIWDSTFKKSELARYGWDKNPYVFVIEFVKISKPAEICNKK